MSLTAHLPWVVGMARWQGNLFDLAQPEQPQPNQSDGRSSVARQGYNPWPRLLIVLLNTSAHVPERFARDHDGASASVPCLLGQQEVETQMHAHVPQVGRHVVSLPRSRRRAGCGKSARGSDALSGKFARWPA